MFVFGTGDDAKVYIGSADMMTRNTEKRVEVACPIFDPKIRKKLMHDLNIMLADTRDIEGKAMGQMIIQLPEDDTDAGRICNYLKTANVKFEEVR